MNETIKPAESIEQKREVVKGWIEELSSKQKVGEISSDVLRDVLEDCKANFKELREKGKKGLSMINEKKRKLGMKEVWGDKFKEYRDWVETYIIDYETRTGNKLPISINKFDIKNEDRKPSERKDKGMLNFFVDITAYASGDLSFVDFKELLQVRLENGLIQELPEEKRKGRKTRRILWDDEIEEGKESYLIKKTDPETGKEIPEGKQLLRPASVPPEFPVKAWEWITQNGLK